MNLTNQVVMQLRNMQIYTYPSADVTVTGTDGSATARIHPNMTIEVDAATMNTGKTITLKTPFAFKVKGLKATASTTMTGLCTVQLKNGSDAITDAVDLGIADTYHVEDAYVDDAYNTFAKDDDDLVLTFAADAGSSPSMNSCNVVISIEPNY